MKSSFLLTIAIAVLMSSNVMGQTTRRRPVIQKKPVQQKPVQQNRVKAKPAAPVTTTSTTTQSTAATAEAPKTSFQKFYDRLSIGYFGVYTSPTLEDWDNGNAAISPQWGDTGKHCRKNCDTYASNIWSQVNFAYDFGWKFKFNIIPRWTTYLANPRDMTRSIGENNAMFGIEDTLIGISGVLFASEDKKFTWWVRPGMRLPTSNFSRHYNNGAFGDITNQFEILSAISYDFNPQWQIGVNLQQRMWVYEDRYNPSRLRLYQNPYVQYMVNDKTKLYAAYENIIENNKRWKSINNLKPHYTDYWQGAMVGVGRDITDRLNLMPYLEVFVDDIPLSTRSAFVGMWISYKIK